MAFGERVLGVDDANWYFCDAEPKARGFGDDFGGDLHAVGAQVQLLGGMAREGAKTGLCVGAVDAEEDASDEVGGAVGEEAGEGRIDA